MRIVLQRVKRADVRVNGDVHGSIGAGVLILLAIGKEDTDLDVTQSVDKLIHLRMFQDEAGKMNRSLLDISGAALVVSQFTLYGDFQSGRRPSFDAAAPPEQARLLYTAFVETLRSRGILVETGIFGAHMDVSLLNSGPVTLIYDSR